MSVEYNAGQCMVCFVLGFGCFFEGGAFYFFFTFGCACFVALNHDLLCSTLRHAQKQKAKSNFEQKLLVPYMCIHAFFFEIFFRFPTSPHRSHPMMTMDDRKNVAPLPPLPQYPLLLFPLPVLNTHNPIRPTIAYFLSISLIIYSAGASFAPSTLATSTTFSSCFSPTILLIFLLVLTA